MKFPEPASTTLLVIDFQEKLIGAMHNIDPVLERARILLSGGAAFGVDVMITEQYPKGLGHTVPQIAELLPEGTVPLEKTGFSAFADAGFRGAFAAKPRKSLIVTGIESHVCVLQSVLDALAQGTEVFLAADAVTSRKESDLALALKAARHAGATVLSSEAILFLMLRDAGHPAFKTVSKLIR